MGKNTNIGAEASLTVYGNPESFRKLIKNHGQLCKIKQALTCPCVGANRGSASYSCEICDGKGFIYTYQRRFFVSDEPSNNCGTTISPFWTPIIDPVKVQNIVAEVQGGISDLTIESFTDDSIVVAEDTPSFQKKRVSYYFDGWTLIEDDKLEVDADNGIMIAPGAVFNALYQSSNPLRAYADIVEIVKIWHIDTGIEITDYTFEGNTISTKEDIEADKMYAEYYISDLTQVITNDIVTKDNNETFTHDLTSGECRMSFYPFWELSRGDIITLPATVLYRNQQLTTLGRDTDLLWEMEIFDLNNIIIDGSGNKYYINTDYILQGRSIKWIGNKPVKGSVISVRYGYKPSYIVFEDNPQPNNLENKQYPKMVFAKSWSKIDKDEVARISNI